MTLAPPGLNRPVSISAEPEDPRHQLEAKIKTLNETVWDSKVGGVMLEEWLNNFSGDFLDADTEKLHALFLLSNVTYYGDREIRGLLKALFRDRFRYPIIRRLRMENAHTRNTDLLERLFGQELRQTRFVPLGDASESGQLIAYYFRQENDLSKTQFVDPTRLVVRARRGSLLRRLLEKLKPSTYLRLRSQVSHVVFIDDFAGTGHQAFGYAAPIVKKLRKVDPNLRISYLVLATTQAALDYLRSKKIFSSVDAAIVLNESDRCLSPSARIFVNPQVTGIRAEDALKLARGYGSQLVGRSDALGYGGGGWLVSFHHNTPDNTLPIFWYDGGKSWKWVLRRHHKY